MRIIVLIKQVPNTNDVKIDPTTGTMIRDGIESIINPDDKFALEAALRLKDANPKVHITVMTMGLPQAEVVLRESLAMGCDRAILITDRAAGGSDTWATSLVLSSAVRKLGKYDLILTGRQAIDGDTAQVGPQTAEKLDIPQVTYVSKLEVKGDHVIVHRDLEDGYQVIEVKMPCLLTAVNGLGKPRYPKFPGIFAAYEADIKQWSMKDIGLAKSTGVGLKGSPTKVFRSFSPKIERAGVVFPDAGRDSVSQLVDSLRDRNLV